ncbi:hypothetical protein [Haloferula helveola]
MKFLLLGILTIALSGQLAAVEPFRIKVVEKGTGWPVPMVELRTTHHARFISDNAGVIAFDLPEMMGEECWFSIEGHGYGVAADGFGFRGVRLTPTSGGEAMVEVERSLPGKRLGRLTGAGLFGESQRFGLEPDWKESGIVGCDTVQIAPHRGKLFWAWGDTSVARYPLGLFQTTSATTGLRPVSSFEPPLRVRYDYFRDPEGRVRNVAEMPGSGPTWISGYVSLPDEGGEPRLVATYVKIRGKLEAYEAGLCVWNESEERFDRQRVLWSKSEDQPGLPLVPDGHPAFWTDPSGKRWLMFGDPFPRIRMEPTFEAWSDPGQWTPMDPQKTVPSRSGGDEVVPHRGSIAWNGFRKKWVAVFTQHHGKPSPLGEIWYAESEQPTGPWGSAVKVVTHSNYTFYNPRLHPELTDPDSPVLLFEGTFTREFSGSKDAWPRYDYNQILYRLDLDDPKLVGE